MFGRRKNSKKTEELNEQSTMILDSLEIAEGEESYDDTMTQEENLIADIFSDSEELRQEGSLDDHTESESVESDEVKEEPRKKKGLFGFLKRNKKSDQNKNDAPLYNEDDVPVEIAQEKSVALSDGESENQLSQSGTQDSNLMKEGEDLVLNPALFALAEEIDDSEEEVDKSFEVPPVEEEIPEAPEAASVEEEIPEVPEDTSVEEEIPEVPEDTSVEEEIPEVPEDTSAEEEILEAPEASEINEDVPEAASDADSEEKAPETDMDSDYDDPLNFDDDDRGSRKKIFMGVGLAVLILGLAAFFIIRNMQKAPEGKAYVQSVSDIMNYDMGSTHRNRYSGIVEAQKQTKVTLEEGMTVEKCYVNVGDDVKKGDRLFKYDTDALNLQAEKKQLEIDQTNQKINNATKKKAEYDSAAKTAKGVDLLDAQQGSAEEELNIETYKLDLQAKKKELNAIKKNIKNSVVKSKTNGQVLKINTALGKGVAEESDAAETGTGEENTDNSYMIIVAKGDYQVRARITETNMQTDGIHRGDSVIIRSRISDATWEGVIKTLSTDQTAEDDSTESEEDSMYGDTGSETDTKYPCVIELSSSKNLMLGQHVLVELGSLATDADDGSKQIVLEASYILDEGGSKYVYADNGRGRIEKRKIEVGEYNEEREEYVVTSGLSMDDMIAAVINVKEGMATTTNEDEAVNLDSGEEDSTGDYYEDSTDFEDFEDFEGEDVDVEGLELDE